MDDGMTQCSMCATSRRKRWPTDDTDTAPCRAERKRTSHLLTGSETRLNLAASQHREVVGSVNGQGDGEREFILANPSVDRGAVILPWADVLVF